MTRWAIGGTMLLAGLAALVCVGMTRSGPEIVVNAAVTPEPAPPVSPRPVEPELPRVFDVADIDPLLDPPPTPAAAGPAAAELTAVGYEEPAAPAPPVGDVPPIPPAAGDDEPAAAAPVGTAIARLTLRPPGFDVFDDTLRVVPFPAGLGELPVRTVRAGWYGDDRGQIDGKVLDFWAEWVPLPPGFEHAAPSLNFRPSVGFGLFF